MKRNKLSRAVRIYEQGKLTACYGSRNHRQALDFLKWINAWWGGPSGVGSESGALAIHFGTRAR